MTDITLNAAYQATVSTAIDAQVNAEDAEQTRMDSSIAVWQALNEMGVDNIGYLNAPKKSETNNMWVMAYHTTYEAISTDMYGKGITEKLYDKLVAREQPLKAGSGRFKGTEKTKQYLQAQVGKRLGTLRNDIKKYIEAGNEKPKAEKTTNTDLDRTLTALAKVIAQMNKKKPDDSIAKETRAMFKNMKPEDLFFHISSVV
tara:strand:- start:52 stop:654 length:603 start_codon:yes stop_codon:yes gene_type:complete